MTKRIRRVSRTLACSFTFATLWSAGCGEKKDSRQQGFELQDADVIPKNMRNTVSDFGGFRKEISKFANAIAPENKGQTALAELESEPTLFKLLRRSNLRHRVRESLEVKKEESPPASLALNRSEKTENSSQFPEFDTKVGAQCGKEFSPLSEAFSTREIAQMLREFSKIDDEKFKRHFETKKPGQNRAFRFGVKPYKDEENKVKIDFDSEISGAANENELAFDFNGTLDASSEKDTGNGTIQAEFYANSQQKKVALAFGTRFSGAMESMKGQGALNTRLELELSKPQKMTFTSKVNAGVTSPQTQLVTVEYSVRAVEKDDLTTHYIYELNENGKMRTIDLDVKRLSKDATECWVSRVGNKRQDTPPPGFENSSLPSTPQGTQQATSPTYRGNFTAGPFVADYKDGSTTVLSKQKVDSISVNYAWSEFQNIDSKNFRATWTGPLQVTSDSALLRVAIDDSWANTTFKLNGKVIAESKSAQGGLESFDLELKKGAHEIQVDYANQWHTVGFNLAFVTENPLDFSGAKAMVQKLSAEKSKIIAVGIYESKSFDREYTIDLSESTFEDIVILASSYHSVRWKIENPKNIPIKGFFSRSYKEGSTVRGLPSQVKQVVFKDNPSGEFKYDDVNNASKNLFGRDPDFSSSEYASSRAVVK
jgi:hypothetical protein